MSSRITALHEKLEAAHMAWTANSAGAQPILAQAQAQELWGCERSARVVAPHPPFERPRRSVGGEPAATASTGDEVRQIEVLEEALDELLRLTPPGDVVIRATASVASHAAGSWTPPCERFSAPEDTSSVSLEIGVGLSISSVGRPL